MKALARFGKAFGGYKMIDVPQPICGPEDVVIEIKAAAICGADMKHYNVDSGSDEFNSIRGHEFAGCIAQVGEKVKDWKVGQRVVFPNIVLFLVKFSKFIVMRCGKSLMVLIMRTQPYLTLSVMPTNPSRSNRNSSLVRMWSSSALAHSGCSPYKWRGLWGR